MDFGFRSRFAAPLFAILLVGLALLPLAAQAPPGPQGTPPAQSAPAPTVRPQQAPPKEKPPQESGVTISVEVPVVTLDVVATTQHGDVITGLKKEFPHPGRWQAANHYELRPHRCADHHGHGDRIQRPRLR